MYHITEIDAFRDALTPPDITLAYPGYEYLTIGNQTGTRHPGLSGLVPVSDVMIRPRENIDDPDCALQMDIHRVLGEETTCDYDAFVLQALLSISEHGSSRVCENVVAAAAHGRPAGANFSLPELFELRLPIALMAGWARSKSLYAPTEAVTLTYNAGAGFASSLAITRMYIQGALNALKYGLDSYVLLTLDTTDFDRKIGLGATAIDPRIDTPITISRMEIAKTVTL